MSEEAEVWDVIVVGAGVAGLGVAWQLAGLGERVLVLEREHAGSGASGAAAGMLAPTSEVHFEEHALLHLGQRSLAMYPEFLQELERASGLDVDHRTHGTLVVGLDGDDTAALKHLYAYQQGLGLDVQWCTDTQARAIEPALSPNVHSAVFCATDHQVDPALLVKSLERACSQAGASILKGAGVDAITVVAERVQGVVLQDGRALRARRVLLAAGAWTRSIQGITRRAMPHIRPIRGQMIALDMGAQPLCEHVVRAPDAYLVPKSDGRLLVGATMEEMGFDARPTAGGQFELLRGAWETMPGVYDMPILDTWVGFRPMSLNNLPVLGPSPHVQGLWFATGHGRNGILLAAITATQVARAMVGQPYDEAIESFFR